ncbi:carbohydrate sulfotransferase 6-like [Microcaecilia unicolor]|uniref:Sulfotransferase n=1 Tax=Microcaecilia unicolor TaxID=1415580 RepID=A0A6P7XS29_9AMPH|nr:carbohydrate sulfotransferase 6-like [Microcaecilia unicolor]
MSGKFRTYLQYLLCAILVLMIWCSTWQIYQVPKQRFNARKTKTHLLILTSWRSGSSFVGQLFNQNHDLFYLTEPAWHVWKKLPHAPPKLLHLPIRDLIRSIFLCDMSVFLPYFSQNKNISNVFMWKESRALCSPPACPESSIKDFLFRAQCNKKCGNVSLEKMEEACRNYSHVVVKTVRIFDLEVLYPLIKDPSLNLKIIHLVRDPRAVFSSREKVTFLGPDDATVSKAQNSKANISVVMEEICKAQEQNYKLALRKPQPFLKGRYVMVRYEDLVKSPVDHTRELYDYVGLTMTPMLESWIYNVTHELLLKEKKFSKNSMKVAQHWREKLNFSKVKEVQKLCQQEMEVFGYQLIESEREQKNMSLDLLLTKPDKLDFIR